MKEMEAEWENGQATQQIYPERGIPPSLSVCGASAVGDREYQQDAMWYMGRKQDFLAAVCDGMGGMEGGEIASARAIEEMERCFVRELVPVQEVPAFLCRTAQKMNQAVCGLADSEGKALECGTTVASVYICGNRAYWLSLGDSKLYLIKKDHMICPFKPHNYQTVLDGYLEKGSISMEEYEREAERGEALTGFLGMGRLQSCEIAEQPELLEPGDQILICSDGLYKALTEDQIRNIVEICRDDFDQTAQVLIQAAQQYGAAPLDNITVVCIRLKDDTEILKKNEEEEDEFSTVS